jgi:hypothetical protein
MTSLELKIRDLSEIDSHTSADMVLRDMTDEEGEFFGVNDISKANILEMYITRRNRRVGGIFIVFKNTEDYTVETIKRLRDKLMEDL